MSRRAVTAAAALAAAVAFAVPAVASSSAPAPSRYTLGADVQSIDPTPAMLADDFYLGGYGLGSGKAAGTVEWSTAGPPPAS